MEPGRHEEARAPPASFLPAPPSVGSFSDDRRRRAVVTSRTETRARRPGPRLGIPNRAWPSRGGRDAGREAGASPYAFERRATQQTGPATGQARGGGIIGRPKSVGSCDRRLGGPFLLEHPNEDPTPRTRREHIVDALERPFRNSHRASDLLHLRCPPSEHADHFSSPPGVGGTER